MDEILHQPRARQHSAYRTHKTPADLRREKIAEQLGSSLGGLIAGGELLAERVRDWLHRTYHATSAKRAERQLIRPIPFLLLSAVIGVSSVISALYVPSYVITVEDAVVGTIRSEAAFEAVVDRVEARTSSILDRDYRLELAPTFDFTFTKKGDLTPIAQIESYLFSGVDEVIRTCSLSVNGTFMGAAKSQEELDAILNRVKAPYVTEHTVSATFVQPIQMNVEYLSAAVEQDPDVIFAALTANTSGETVYEVSKGDTFSGIAKDSGMTVEELKALNPDVDVEHLYIGQLLTVKEEVPYLSVRTVDNLTYEAAVPCPVEEVPDDTMYEGESRVVDVGVPGVAMVNADVTYLNGKEQERNILSSQNIQEPTTRIIAVGTKERPTWYPTGSFIWPVSGRITSRFGWRTIFGSYSYHSGLDIGVPTGTSIKAADGGKVTYAGWRGAYGYLVVIDHLDGTETYYGHNSKLCVSAGDKVYQGQTIAKSGSSGRSTGPHCHFEVRKNGTRVNPIKYLP